MFFFLGYNSKFWVESYFLFSVRILTDTPFGLSFRLLRFTTRFKYSFSISFTYLHVVCYVEIISCFLSFLFTLMVVDFFLYTLAWVILLPLLEYDYVQWEYHVVFWKNFFSGREFTAKLNSPKIIQLQNFQFCIRQLRLFSVWEGYYLSALT